MSRWKFWSLAAMVGLLGCDGARAQAPHSVTLTWGESPGNVSGFLVQRGTTSGGPYAQIGGTVACPPGWAATHAYAIGATVFDANGHVQKVTAAGTSGASAPAWNSSGGTTTDGSVTWTDQSGSFSYVDLSTTGNVLVEGATYYYVAVATGPGGNSLPSNQASATIPFLSPPKPNSLQAVPQ